MLTGGEAKIMLSGFAATVAANIDFFEFCNGIDRLGSLAGGRLAFMRVGFLSRFFLSYGGAECPHP
jgi:hypothetical protein